MQPSSHMEDKYVSVETPKGEEPPLIEPQSPKMASFSEMFQFADSTDYALMIVGTLAAMGTGVSQPMQVLIFGDFINVFSVAIGDTPLDADEFQSNINTIVYKFMGVAAAILISGFGQIVCWSIAASRQGKRLREAYAKAILRQEIGWFDVNEPAQLATRVAETTLLAQEGMGRKVGDGINFFSMALASLIMAFSYGWELALVLIALTPFMGASAFFMTKAITAAVQGGVVSYAQAGGIAEESLSNIKTVHMFNAMPTMANKYIQALTKTEKMGVKKGLAVGLGTGGMLFIMLCTYALGMYYGAVKITNDKLGDPICTGSRCYDGGRVVTVFFCVVIGSMAIGQAGPSIQAIMTGRSAAFEIFQLIGRTSEIDATSNSGDKLNNVEGRIALEAVRFAYPSRPDVTICDGYSLVIPAGQKIALVGSSGSGKSTIVSLVERFYDPLSGRVTLDGHDVKNLNVSWLRAQFGLVGQEPALFSDTIAANIRRGKPDASMEEVYEAAKQANAYDFIMGFPEKFDTQVGDRGAQLSGGQKQRIAIARAIIKNPAVLLLDEATSALDTESEHIVQESLDKLVASHRRTTIIIAHRLSTIRNADRIVVLDQGRVVEDGTHESLLALEHGHYKGLVEAQQRHKVHEEVAVATKGTKKNMTKAVATSASTDTTAEGVASETDSDLDLSHQVSLLRVWKLSQPEAVHLVFGSLGAIVHGSLYPIWGVLLTKCTMVYFKLDLGSDGMRDEALKWTIGFIIMGATIFVAITVQNHQFAIVSERLTARIRKLCFQAMLRQDLAWFDDPKNSPGALTTRLASDSAAIRSMTSETLNAILLNASTLGVAFGISFYYSWRMTLIFLAVIPVMASAQMLQMQMETSQTGKSINDGDIKAGALLSEAINSIRTVASFCMETTVKDSYYVHLQKSALADRSVGIRGGVAYSVSQSSVLFALAGVFYYGGWLVPRGLLDFESMFMVFNAILFCTFGVGIASQALGEVGKARKAVGRIFEIIDRHTPIDCTAESGLKLQQVDGVLELKDVGFSYPTRPDSTIYNNYNLRIEAGQTVALVGGSGSGKSTAINLIERFYDPSSGSVLLDGYDLKSINVESLRNNISIVSQEPVLFSGTIAENIATGMPGATKDEIIDAAKKANAHNFIMQFPDGYDTSVGDRGVQVSGGQKQRIAIARAIIRDPAILLLDEATSALDNESERIVQESLDNLLQLKRRTTIIVAHRLSTIRHADVIAVVDGGRVAEKGTHDQLMSIPGGIYANLVHRQMQ